MKSSLAVVVSLWALVALGYFLYPGHAWLQEDTQIYVPLFQRMLDPTLYAQDSMVRRPHVTFTIYDEVTVALTRRLGGDMRQALVWQQWLFRFCALVGVYLICRSLGLASPGSLLVSAALALGATISGPAVLLVEYEPVPRGFAVGLLLLAVGLAARGQDTWCGVAGALAFLYHPPTVWPFWVAFFVLTLWPGRAKDMERRYHGLLPLVPAVAALLVVSRMQSGQGEAQLFFSRIDPWWEELMRWRAPYNWVSTWLAHWLPHYLILLGILVAAAARLWRAMNFDLKVLVVGMAAAGMGSLPVAQFLLEEMKWVMIPQLQPQRAVLFVTAFAMILAGGAGVLMGAKRWWEGFLWFLVVYAIPAPGRIQDVFLGAGNQAPQARLLAAVAISAALSAGAVWLAARRPVLGAAAVALAMAAPFILLPKLGEIRNIPQRHTLAVHDLARWVERNTPREAVLLFPDSGRERYPGIVRAMARRSLYVDWKSGGQVNFLREYSQEWKERWDAVMGRVLPAGQWEEYRRRGIDYVIVKKSNAPAGVAPIYANADFAVYEVGGRSEHD